MLWGCGGLMYTIQVHAAQAVRKFLLHIIYSILPRESSLDKEMITIPKINILPYMFSLYSLAFVTNAEELVLSPTWIS